MKDRRACALVTFFALSCGAAVDLGGAPGDGGDDATSRDGGEGDSRTPAMDVVADTPGDTARDAPLDTDGNAGDGSEPVCGNLAPPTAPAPCRACNPDASACQANGCFNGYYCDVTITDCEPLPARCEAGAPLGACTGYDPPGAPAPCTACTAGAANCQANGCFNGYYCEVATVDCQPAPAGCDAGH
jgi:hypothetical protein